MFGIALTKRLYAIPTDQGFTLLLPGGRPLERRPGGFHFGGT